MALLTKSVQDSCLAIIWCLPLQCARKKASLEDLAYDCPSYPLSDVPKARHCSNSLCSQLCPLLQVLGGQWVQDLFFAPEELEELEVRLGPIADAAPWHGAEYVLTPPRPVCKQAEAPLITGGDCDFPQATPGDAIHEVDAKGLVL